MSWHFSKKKKKSAEFLGTVQFIIPTNIRVQKQRAHITDIFIFPRLFTMTNGTLRTAHHSAIIDKTNSALTFTLRKKESLTAKKNRVTFPVLIGISKTIGPNTWNYLLWFSEHFP